MMDITINSVNYEIIDSKENGDYLEEFKLKKDKMFYILKKIRISDKANKVIDKYKVLCKINNDYIIKYYTFFIEDDYFNILMEYPGDFSLKQFIEKADKKDKSLIKERDIKDILNQICLGLKEIHKNNIIHGNLKSENIFIDKNNNIKIGDFYTNNNTITNKKSDNSSEIKPEVNNNYSLDMYSLGCIMYELFTLNEYHPNDLEKNKINSIYNQNWQELIDLLLSKDNKNIPKIEEIYYNYKYPLRNEIRLGIKINKEDIGKKIYFLDNTSNHDHLKEINKLNTEIYINNSKKNDFEKYFIPIKNFMYFIKIYFNFFIKDCSFMFKGCTNIKEIDLSSFNTKNATNMSNMFNNCQELDKINLSSINTENVTNMSLMFYNCSKLNNIDLSPFITKNVKSMDYMFGSCCNLETINLSSFDFNNVNDMSYIFCDCNKLKSIDLSNFKNNLDEMIMFGIFAHCDQLTEVKFNKDFQDKMIKDNPYYKDSKFNVIYKI